jgi:hypothetical protein
MAEMSVSMIMRLVDQITGPAKGVESELEKLKRATTALNEIQKGPMRSSQWDDAQKTVSRRRQELEAQQKVEAETAAAVQASASKQVSAIRELESVREQAARVTIASEQAELAAVKEAEAGKLRAVEVSAREQAAAVRSLERQRSRAHQQMVIQADREARASKENHGIMSRHGAGGVALAAGAGYVGVHSVFGGVEKALEAGAERQHIEVKAVNAGIPATEIARIRQASIEAKRGAPNMNVSEIEELFVEARSAVKHPEETFHILNDLARAGSVLKGMGLDNSGVALLVKAAESGGRMNSPEQFKVFMDDAVKAMQVFGKTIDPEQIYEAIKYSKSAAGTLSDHFIGKTLPSLVQEMRGSSAGDAIYMLTKTLRGGLEHRGTASELLNSVGLTPDQSKIHHNKAGKVTGYGGSVKESSLLATNPDEWVWKIYKPALEKAGYDTLEKQIEFTNRTMPGTAANLVRVLLQQEESIRQHQANLEAAADAQTAAANQAKEATAAFGALGKSLDDLRAAATSPAMEKLAGGLNKISGFINWLSERAAEHPTIAVSAGAGAGAAALGGAGWLSFQLMRGFGLPAAATELTVAAKALDGAAAKLGAGSALHGPGGLGAPGDSKAPGLGWRGAFMGLSIGSAVFNMPQTPEEFKKQAESNDQLQSTVEAKLKKYLPSWLFPDKAWLERATEPTTAPKVDSQHLDDAKAKADETQKALQGLNATLTPQINMGPIDALLAKLGQAKGLMASLGASHPAGKFVPSSGALHDGPEAR